MTPRVRPRGQRALSHPGVRRQTTNTPDKEIFSPFSLLVLLCLVHCWFVVALFPHRLVSKQACHKFRRKDAARTSSFASCRNACEIANMPFLEEVWCSSFHVLFSFAKSRHVIPFHRREHNISVSCALGVGVVWRGQKGAWLFSKRRECFDCWLLIATARPILILSFNIFSFYTHTRIMRFRLGARNSILITAPPSGLRRTISSHGNNSPLTNLIAYRTVPFQLSYPSKCYRMFIDSATTLRQYTARQGENIPRYYSIHLHCPCFFPFHFESTVLVMSAVCVSVDLASCW